MPSRSYRIRRLVEELQAKAARLGIPVSVVGDYGARDPVEAPRIVYRGVYRGQVVEVDPIGVITAYPHKQPKQQGGGA